MARLYAMLYESALYLRTLKIHILEDDIFRERVSSVLDSVYATTCKVKTAMNGTNTQIPEVHTAGKYLQSITNRDYATYSGYKVFGDVIDVSNYVITSCYVIIDGLSP